jgi:Tol biopolymer transport system component
LTADKSAIVAIQESENLHLWRFDPETGAVQQITSGVSRAEGRYGLAFAPDGRIIFTARERNNYDIFSVDSNGGEVNQLTKNAGRNLDAVVSSDNQFIAFVSDRTGPWRLWLMNRDGTEAHQVTAVSDEKELSENSPYFSEDGRWIYYVEQRPGQSAIRKISVDGGESQVVMSGDGGVDKPVPSPDGKLLAHAAYTSGATSPWQVAVDSLDGETTSKTFSDFPAFRSRVRWMLDSSSVVSVDDRTGGYNLWLTNLTNGSRQPVTNFKTDKIYRFDISPDRRSYVLARGDYFYDAVRIEP